VPEGAGGAGRAGGGVFSETDQARFEEEDDGWRLVVLDVSALMWAPRSVRRLMARGWEVIVPLEGGSVLMCEF
jgi:hypothetical protein